ncbi:phospholipase D-like domain-containing protein [uncultured Sphingomonas sp.]|uniref:phospholipase D-like domain-containing protein n=1 Tax=uncultured Sphingomonas sp. TaxID=158754 RepID=UPI0025E8E271|nr:phospholipase D-like domain-containing protein [uncultured Sphingomonas sp.]
MRRHRLVTYVAGAVGAGLLAASGYATVRVLQAGSARIADVHRGTAPAIGPVLFGGPDRPAGTLRDMLRARVDAVPPGGRIDWATYYFRDRDLAGALIRASDRGVAVRLVVEGDPRLAQASDAALCLLRRHGLRGGLVLRPPAPRPLRGVNGRLHAKIYAFSAPQAIAFVGSFNPSGDSDVDQAVIDQIGDQDRGHNLLVGLTGEGLVATLRDHVTTLADGRGRTGHFAAANNRIYRDGDTDLIFYPRLRPYVVEHAVDGLGRGDRLWAAISHLKADMVDRLAMAATRGASLALVVHDTERRVPTAAVERLSQAGVRVRRYRHPDHLPMHAKFIVIEQAGRRTSYFGSLNYNRNSRWLNDEVLVRSGDQALARTLLERFGEIGREVDAQERAAR